MRTRNEIRGQIVNGCKICSKCKLTKTIDGFYTNHKTKSGLASWCKDCSNRLGREKKYYNNPESKAKTKEYGLKYRCNKLYGITVEEYDRIFELQGKKCKICGSENPQRKDGGWSLDHNHITGKVRGILCFPCNIMLGTSKDNPQVLRDAAIYLESNV